MLYFLPINIQVFFIFVTLAAVYGCYYCLNKSAEQPIAARRWHIVAAMGAWLLVQGGLTLAGLYRNYPTALPPLLVVLGIFPTIVVMLWLVLTQKGRHFLGGLPLRQLTLLHSIRLAVEIGLFMLYKNGFVPQSMTFEGVNADILMGITAPIVAWLAFSGQQLIRPTLLLYWNIAGVLLLFNIVLHAILSAPSPLQQWAFEQPNVAILHFPVSWLPTFIVPVVLLSHVAAVMKLTKKTNK